MTSDGADIRHAVYLSLLMVLLASSAVAAARLASETASTAAIVTVQYAICLLCSLPACLKPGLENLKTTVLGLHLVRGLAGVLGFYLFYAALANIPLVDASLLRQSAPLIVPVVIFLWIRERIPSGDWLPLIIGFAGVVIILRPGPQGLSWWHLAGFLSAAALAVTMVATFRLATTEPDSRILFYYFVISLLCVAPFSLADFSGIQTRDWLAMIYVGVTFYYALVLYTRAYGIAPASTIAPLNYLTVPLGGLWGWLLWQQVPDLWSVTGSALVIAGGLLTLYRTR